MADCKEMDNGNFGKKVAHYRTLLLIQPRNVLSPAEKVCPVVDGKIVFLQSNHSFKEANCAYGLFFSPRFGAVVNLVSTRRIRRGEEILVDYGYGGVDVFVPEWYKRLHKKEFPEMYGEDGRRKDNQW